MGYIYGLGIGFDSKQIASPFIAAGQPKTALAGPAGILDRCLDLNGDRVHGRAAMTLAERFHGRDALADHVRNITGGGIVIHLPAGHQAAQPLRLDVELAGQSLERLLLVAEPGSRATVVVRRQGGGLSACLTEAVIGDGAEINLVRVQDLAPGDDFSRLQASLGRQARLALSECLFGGGYSASWAEVELDGSAARFDCRTVLAASGEEKFDLHRVARHRAGQSQSSLETVAVMLDRSKTVERALIAVEPGAKGCRGRQKTATLLLGRGADFSSLPQLEVGEEDVNCSHASSIGQIDREQLFYLMARGFDRQSAERRLVEGFAEPLLAAMRESGLAEMVGCLLAQRFANNQRSAN